MIETWVKVLLIAALLPILMGLLSAATRRTGLPAECNRKLLHVGMGSVTLSLPWLIGQSAPVTALAALAGAWLLAVRISPKLMVRFGAALHRVNRPSAGEIYFAAGTAISHVLAAGNVLCFALPMALLTYADTAAAMAGALRAKDRHFIGINDKSLEGCAAFFAVSVLCTVTALAFATHATPTLRLSVAAQLAFDTTVLEIIGARGSDNLLIPMGAAYLLPLLLNGSPAVPAMHAALAAMLILLWRAQRAAVTMRVDKKRIVLGMRHDR